MASTYTNNLNLELQAAGERARLVGLNDNFGKIDQFAGEVNPKKTNITSLASDSTILELPHGVYQVNLSASSSYLPGRYGTLIVDRSNVTYGAVTFITTGGNVYTRHMNGTSSWHNSWTQLAPYESGTWTPKLYDLDTYKRDLPSGAYYKVGNLVIAYFSANNTADLSGISTMLQIRNLPMTVVFGGGIYISAMSGQGGTITIQSTNGNVLFRPNIISANISTPETPGWVTCWLVGVVT